VPNWCENVIQVRGIAPERAEFRRRATSDESPLSFTGHVPPPDSYPGLEAYADSEHPLAMMMRTRPETFEPWYLWRLLHWGCKWDIAPEDLQLADPDPADDAGVLEYRFLSAWSPPEPWLIAASAQHPELAFSLWYMEQSNDFAGVLELRSGVTVSEAAGSPADLRGQLEAAGLEVWDPEEDIDLGGP